jgi:phosphoribosylglycinamide formyltransferase 1
VVQWFCQGRLRCDASGAHLDGQPLGQAGYAND